MVFEADFMQDFTERPSETQKVNISNFKLNEGLQQESQFPRKDNPRASKSPIFRSPLKGSLGVYRV